MYAGQPSQEFLDKAVVHGHLQELYPVNEYGIEYGTKTLETLVKQLQWRKIALDYNTEFRTFECFSDLFEQWHLGPQNMAMTANGRRELTFYAKFPVKEFTKHVDIAPDKAWKYSIVHLRKEHPDGPFYVRLKVKREFNCHTYCHLAFAKK
ncbi:hypothetical protein QR680_002418 [Steinernema hermaphroditum]|uniref:Uncharacterized protein n=1 Tax=Steinernema hermaphroditum TaxID=289476 RepID=A0AA39H2L7_9BILA|nr:hypothetical protein QR680_002418 [Steinernema hermaphroditum]